jgi:lipoyl(octanoyl) transferase
MDLEPFGRINPCGLQGLAVTQIADFAPGVDIDAVRAALLDNLANVYGISLRRSDSRDPA